MKPSQRAPPALLVLLSFASTHAGPPPAPDEAADCNQNGIDDALDLTPPLLLQAGASWPAPPNPLDVAAADLDADGRADLAVSSATARSVFVHFSSGDPELPVQLKDTWRPGPLQVADLNQDGHLDLLAGGAGYDEDVIYWVRAGKAPELFDLNAIPLTTPGRSAIPIAVFATDLDADGDLDLIAGDFVTTYDRPFPFDSDPRFSTTIHFVLSDGVRTFTQGEPLDAGEESRSLALGDLDGDGDLDLAMAQPSKVQLLLAAGGGRTYEPRALTAPSDPVRIAAADLDLDGDLDLVTANSLPDTPIDDNVSVFPNEGRATFGRARNTAIGKLPSDLEVVDADGDGDPDILVANERSRSVSLLRNLGGLRLLSTTAVPDLVEPRAIAVGDIDGDGGQDLAAICDSPTGDVDSLQIFRGGGARGLFCAGSARVQAVPAAIAAADFNGDQLDDVAAVGYGLGAVSILLSDPEESLFSREAGGEIAGGALASADLDQDGDLDLAVTGDRRLGILLNEGLGALGPPRGLLQEERAITGVEVADLDADGRADIVVGGWPLLAVLPGLGGGEFAAPEAADMPYSVSDMAIGDLDADGRPDVATAGVFDAKLSVAWNTGEGKLGSRLDIDLGRKPILVLAGDVDGDGLIDLAGASEDPVGSFLLLGTGKRALSPVAPLGLDGIARAVLVDLDRDGDLDFAGSEWQRDGLAIARNDGRGALTFLQRLATGSAPRSVAAGDLNGDGQLDLVAGSSVSPRVAVVWNRGVAAVSRDTNRDGIPDECEPAFLRGDCDGRGESATIADAVFLLRFNFQGSEPPPCLAACDADGDGQVPGAVSDALYLLTFSFLGGPPPVQPFPACGVRALQTDLELGCDAPQRDCGR